MRFASPHLTFATQLSDYTDIDNRKYNTAARTELILFVVNILSSYHRIRYQENAFENCGFFSPTVKKRRHLGWWSREVCPVDLRD